MDKPREITLEAFKNEVKAQGVERIDVAVICPLCDTPQSMRALIAAGAGATEADVEKFIGFSCIGRFTGAGSGFAKDHPKGKGCDYTLGGLFKLPRLMVLLPDGEKFPHFEIAPKEQAEALRQSLMAGAQ